MKIRIGTLYRLKLVNHLGEINFPGPVMDIGCNDGLLLSSITSPLKVGVDISLPKEKSTDYNFVCADANFLPFKKEVFSQIFLLDVIEHIEEDYLLSDSISFVLSKKGYFLITTPSKNIRLNPFFLTKAISKKWGHHFRLGYTKNELINIFQSNFYIRIDDWNAPYWRFFYLIIRFSSEISYKFSFWLINKVFNCDKKLPQGNHGYYILRGIKENE